MLDDLPNVTYRFDKATREHVLIVDGHQLRHTTNIQISDHVGALPEVTVTFIAGSLNATDSERTRETES